MEIEGITTDALERAMRKWHNAQEPPTQLLELHLLSEEHSASSTEQGIKLQEILQSIVVEGLTRHREAAGISTILEQSTSRVDLMVSLSADYAKGSADLEAWSAVYHRYFAPSSLSVKELAAAANVSTRQFNRRLRSGVIQMRDVLRREEMKSHSRLFSSQLRRHLPQPEYIHLFGITSLLQKLMSLLTDADGPRFISIEGLGGIGKTALAQATAHRIAERGGFIDIPWISARQEKFTEQGDLLPVSEPARTLDDVVTGLAKQVGQDQLVGTSTSHKLDELRQLLSVSSYLVVIDNLETLTDIQLLIPSLHPLAGSTRFLFTSRHTLRDHPFVHVLPVPELSFADSQALLESELTRRGNGRVLTPASMREIYSTIGGLPLALKLVAAQMGHLRLTEILTGLRQVRHQTPEKMYTYIYHRTWRLLDDATRKLLLSMLLISADGENVEWTRLNSALPERDFNLALEQLHNYSLLEVTGSAEEPIYRLHRMTITFLQTEMLVNWDETRKQNL